ncbi:MAG: hypothetical protein N3F05_01660 [Candidatus Diapherotrites archaeon]|nr:hypothetical protein [Candidatus Diapherotrites archaeon]
MEDYVVKSKIKEYAKSKDIRIAGDFFDGLNKVIQYKLDKAVERAKENGRKTLRGFDL